MSVFRNGNTFSQQLTICQLTADLFSLPLNRLFRETRFQIQHENPCSVCETYPMLHPFYYQDNRQNLNKSL